jgi:hypothetical protein
LEKEIMIYSFSSAALCTCLIKVSPVENVSAENKIFCFDFFASKLFFAFRIVQKKKTLKGRQHLVGGAE